MKNLLFLLASLLWFSCHTNAQVIIDTTNNSQPSSAAMLEVKSTTKGFLPPRMSAAQRNAIVTPANGLMVYCTDCGPGGTGAVSIYLGVNKGWSNFSPCLSCNAPAPATHVPYPTQIIWKWRRVLNAQGYKWSSTRDSINAVDMGTDTTKTETGLNNCNPLYTYTRYVWAYSCGFSNATSLAQTTSNSLAAPVSGTHTTGDTQITWTWAPVAGATGYRWSSANDYNTATDLGTANSKTETGLVCGIIYTRYVWAYTSCVHSNVTTLTQTININPSSPVEGTHIISPIQIIWKWNPVSGAVGYKWSDLNNIVTAKEMGLNTSKVEYGLNCNTSYTRYVWAYGSCGYSPVTKMVESTSDNPDSPDTAIHIASRDQIIWKWDTVSGATGYKWNTHDNYNSATDMLTATSKTETGLTCGNNYTRYVWAYNSCGHSGSTILSQNTSLCPFANCGTATLAYGGKIYSTVVIDNHCWLKQNLNIGIKIDSNQNQTNNSIIEKYCYRGDTNKCNIYGGLYQWAEMVQYLNGATNTTSWNPLPTGYVQGICPPGWHIPSDGEWTNLGYILGGESVAGGKMKELGLIHWASPNTGATNSSGFTALPGGYRNSSFWFYPVSYNGYFWSTTEGAANSGWVRYLLYNSAQMTRDSNSKTIGLSVRCVND